MTSSVLEIESRAGAHYAQNEDRYLCEPATPLFAVLDGEGHGGRAADVALESLRGRLEAIALAVAEGPERAAAELTRAVREANSAASSGPWRGCGTTLTCRTVSRGTLVVAHVGDSRLYLHGAGGWRSVTVDHSLVQNARAHDPTADVSELIEHHSNVITRALGLTEQLTPQVTTVPLPEGGLVMLCTDGLWRPFDPRLEGAPPPDLTPPKLKAWLFGEYARAGERDNATC